MCGHVRLRVWASVRDKRARIQANNPYRSHLISFTITGTGLLVQHGVAAPMVYLKFFRLLRAPAESDSGLKETLIFEAILSGLSLRMNINVYMQYYNVESRRDFQVFYSRPIVLPAAVGLLLLYQVAFNACACQVRFA
jgi:hypothetical protein